MDNPGKALSDFLNYSEVDYIELLVQLMDNFLERTKGTLNRYGVLVMTEAGLASTIIEPEEIRFFGFYDDEFLVAELGFLGSSVENWYYTAEVIITSDALYLLAKPKKIELVG